MVSHLIAVSVWAGIVLGETVLEQVNRRQPAAREFVARTHYWIDLTVELPIIGMVIATGAALAVGAWPLPPLFWAHLTAGGVAIGANLYCVSQVVARARSSTVEQWELRDRRVRASAVGVLFALAAVVVGFSMVGH